MKLQPSIRRDEAGTVVFNALVAAGVLGVGAVALVSLGNNRLQASYDRWDYNEAYYHAENALTWAMQRLADNNAGLMGNFSYQNGNVGLDYLTNLLAANQSKFNNVWVTVTNEAGANPDVFLVTASAKVGGRTRTVQASVWKNARSRVFDYEYFLNNWGWWWGSTITGWGDNRANWDFDFRYNPAVNGQVIASGEIACNGTAINPLSSSVPLAGLAGSNPTAYLEDGSPRLPMPNLRDLSYYESKAIAGSGTLRIGTNTLVTAVHSNGVQPGMYLVGTDANPIRINGPVVIPGDVIIKGKITGTGTLYVGGNLYVAGNTTYANGPDYTSAPESMSASARDTWVQNANSAGKDLIGFAVRGSIFGGNPNSSQWKWACYDPSAYGLNQVGAEASLGADGIAHTPDDGVPFWDSNGDGTLDSAWYDADNDGVVDGNYNYNNDIKVDSTRASLIANYPTTTTSSGEGNGNIVPEDFNNLASNYFNRLDGIYYCNHACAMRAATAHLEWNGALICRDEAIIFSSTCKFRYDSRVHSRYADTAANFIDLGLPTDKLRLLSLSELAPINGFCSSNVKIAAAQ